MALTSQASVLFKDRGGPDTNMAPASRRGRTGAQSPSEYHTWGHTGNMGSWRGLSPLFISSKCSMGFQEPCQVQDWDTWVRQADRTCSVSPKSPLGQSQAWIWAQTLSTKQQESRPSQVSAPA